MSWNKFWSRIHENLISTNKDYPQTKSQWLGRKRDNELIPVDLLSFELNLQNTRLSLGSWLESPQVLPVDSWLGSFWCSGAHLQASSSSLFQNKCITKWVRKLMKLYPQICEIWVKFHKKQNLPVKVPNIILPPSHIVPNTCFY